MASRRELLDYAGAYGYLHFSALFDEPFWDGKETLLAAHPEQCIRAFMLDERVLSIAHLLCGDDLEETGENRQNDLASRPYKDFHADAPFTPANGILMPLWRFGIYFRDYTKHSGGLRVVPESHLGPISYNLGEPHRVDTVPRDLVVWNLRTFHAAHAKNGDLPEASPRHAIFFDYAAPGADLDRYVDWRAKRLQQRKQTEMKDSAYGLH